MKSYRKIHRYRKKKSILKNRFFWPATLILVCLTSLFSFLFFSGTFLIEKIIVLRQTQDNSEPVEWVVTGQEKVSKEAIVSLVVPENIFLVDKKAIRVKILESFPQIAEVEISRNFPDSLNILVIERVSAGVWCQEDDCFLLDSEGIIFEKTAVEDEAQQVLIRNLNGGELVLGDRAVEGEELYKILKIDSDLKSELNIKVEGFTISPDNKLIVLAEGGWEIYFNLANDIDWQVTKLGAVLEEKIPPEERDNLEYIDLRFGNFAPYKYKD